MTREPTEPLFLFFDCKAADSINLHADIVEVAIKCDPLVFPNPCFQSLIHTEEKLSRFTVKTCGIRKKDLQDKDTFPVVFRKMVKWIKNITRRANRKKGKDKTYFPVLCAHGGFKFDFKILINNMVKHDVTLRNLRWARLHFADTLEFCKELQDEGFEPLQATKLDMADLHSRFSSGEKFVDQHRALGDVKAMVTIFGTGPLRVEFGRIKYKSYKSLCVGYELRRKKRKLEEGQEEEEEEEERKDDS